MQKKLFTQIRNEWRGNLWLALELLVVSVVMWYIIDLLYCRLATYNEPRGFDTEHCYLIQMGVLTDKSPDYKEDANEHDDVLALAERLRHRPEVEAVSLSQNAYPYNGSNSTDHVDYDTLSSPSWTIRRLVTPDFVRVFRYRGVRGETPEQLAEMLRRGDFLASDNLYRKYGIRMTSLAGKDGFHLFGDTTYSFRLGAALQDVRYSDFQQAMFSYTFVINMDNPQMFGQGIINPDNELCVRVKDNMDKDFIARLKADSESQYRIGNLYIADIRSFADIRRSFQQSEMNQLRNYCAGMGFLLLNMLLSPADSHRARRRHRLPAGARRAEHVAQWDDAGGAALLVLRCRHLRAYRADDSRRHLVSRPPGDEGAAGRGVARRVKQSIAYETTDSSPWPAPLLCSGQHRRHRRHPGVRHGGGDGVRLPHGGRASRGGAQPDAV